MNTASKIKAIRKEIGLSQQALADKMGVGRSAVAALELGDNQLSSAMKSLLIKTVHVSPEWLDTGEGDMFVEVDPEDDLMEWAADVLRDKPESFRRHIVTALRVFSMEDWEEIEKLCDKLLEANKKTAPEGAADGTTEDSAE